jgi:hypothetical protein
MKMSTRLPFWTLIQAIPQIRRTDTHHDGPPELERLAPTAARQRVMVPINVVASYGDAASSTSSPETAAIEKSDREAAWDCLRPARGVNVEFSFRSRARTALR